MAPGTSDELQDTDDDSLLKLSHVQLVVMTIGGRESTIVKLIIASVAGYAVQRCTAKTNYYKLTPPFKAGVEIQKRKASVMVVREYSHAFFKY